MDEPEAAAAGGPGRGGWQGGSSGGGRARAAPHCVAAGVPRARGVTPAPPLHALSDTGRPWCRVETEQEREHPEWGHRALLPHAPPPLRWEPPPRQLVQKSVGQALLLGGNRAEKMKNFLYVGF